MSVRGGAYCVVMEAAMFLRRWLNACHVCMFDGDMLSREMYIIFWALRKQKDAYNDKPVFNLDIALLPPLHWLGPFTSLCK